jgi:hypothetical protein
LGVGAKQGVRDDTYNELAMIKRMLSPVAGLGTFLVSCTEAAERAIEVRLKTNEATRKARRSLPGIGGMPIMYVEIGKRE